MPLKNRNWVFTIFFLQKDNFYKKVNLLETFWQKIPFDCKKNFSHMKGVAFEQNKSYICDSV